MRLNDLFEEYDESEEAVYLMDMNGWVRFQPVLTEIESPLEVQKRLYFEFRNKRRPYIITRLLQKFNKVRSKEVLNVWEDYRKTGIF
jgi:hypothetical protein